MLSYNSTNSYFNPTRGSSVNLSVDLPVGSSGRHEHDPSLIGISPFHSRQVVEPQAQHLRLPNPGQYIQAYGNTYMPFFDRFFIGGETTIRGFDIRSISPLAISSTASLDASGNPIIDLDTGLPKVNRGIIAAGGDAMAIFNGEYGFQSPGTIDGGLL